MTDYTGLIARLRDNAAEKHQEAWGRQDGGLDLSIGAMLADEAADAIEALQAEVARLGQQTTGAVAQD